MKRLIRTCIVLSVGAALFGCSTHRLTGVEPQLVENKTWVLTSMNGEAVSGPRVTMVLRPASAEDGRIGGHAQCNRYFGSYQVADNKLSFTPMGSGRAACPEPFMTEETEYLAMFPQLDNIAFKGHRMTLCDSGSNEQMTFVSESAFVSGQIAATQGSFAAGSEIIIVLQDSSRPDDPAGIIGIERIPVDSNVDVVDYVVKYAPELVNPDASYEVLAEVIENGQAVFFSTEKPHVNLRSTPVDS